MALVSPTFAVGFPQLNLFGDTLTDILGVLPSGNSESSQVDNGDKLPQEDTSETQVCMIRTWHQNSC